MNNPGRTPTPADESSTAPCNDRPASLHGHSDTVSSLFHSTKKCNCSVACTGYQLKATHSPAQKHNLLCNFSGRYETGLSKLANEFSSLHLTKVIQRACLEHRRINCTRRNTEHIHPCSSISNSVCHAQRLPPGQAESSWTGHTILALDISQRHTCLFKLSQKFAGNMHLANSRPQHNTC